MPCIPPAHNFVSCTVYFIYTILYVLLYVGIHMYKTFAMALFMFMVMHCMQFNFFLQIIATCEEAVDGILEFAHQVLKYPLKH